MRLKNYPERWKMGVTEALAEFVLAHCAFLDSSSKTLSWTEPKLASLSDTLSSQKTSNKCYLSGLASERQALEMQLSLFSKHAQLRPGDRSGYLWKHGNLLKEWKRRFFFTKDHCLWYFRSGEEIKYTELQMSKATDNRSSEWPFAIALISAKGTIDLLAESQTEMEEWIYALNSLAEATILGNSHSDDYRCADCTARAAQWCSLNLGVMLCSECSGVHRSLGSHVSKVRSLQIDNLRDTTKEVVAALHAHQDEVWGSAGKVSAVAAFAEREAHIREKYITRTHFQAVSDPAAVLTSAIARVDLVSAARAIHSRSDIVQCRSPSFLHLAVAARSKLMLQLLLLCGAELAVRDAAGLTVLDAALLTQETDLVAFLLENLDSK